MSCSLRPLAAALGVVASLAAPASALGNSGSAPNSLTCTGIVSGGTYSSLTVPHGQNCFLSNATVLGPANVESTASLDLEGTGTIGGNVLVGDQASMSEAQGWVIRGTTVGNGAGLLTILGTVHSVLLNNTATLGIQSATVDGSIVSNHGTFGGNIVSSVIHGDVFVNGTTPGLPVLASNWFIAGPQLNGDKQEIDGSVVLTNNQSSIYVFENHIHENLICAGNNPPPFNSAAGFTNTVDGRSVGQCATTNSPPTAAQARAALRAVASPTTR
jgi:hypothetical protein